LAQHAEDQAETFLLQALRGSGTDGLSAIPRKRRFGRGFMGRPLLNCSKDSLRNLAELQDLVWIEDPSNADDRFDRNFLRLHVMPLLKERWPAAVQTLGRSAQRSAAASQTLIGLAQQDLNKVTLAGTSELSLKALRKLPRERAFTVLRLFVRQRGLRMPRLQDLTQVMSDLVEAREDSNGIVNVRDPLTITETGLTLTKELCHQNGITLPDKGSISVKSRAGGELLKVGEPAFHKAVKKILQESSIPPWIRDTIPLLYIDGRLAAVWGGA